jgi:alkylation response protein AidB-like acyl-CoA dehydrogenase
MSTRMIRKETGRAGLCKGTMQATFTEEQEQLAELAARIAERVRRDAPTTLADGGAQIRGAMGWPLLADSGLVGLRLPAAVGGGDTSAVELAIVAEALGRQVAPVPFIGPVLAAELLAAGGADSELLSEVASGERRITVALDRSLGTLARLDTTTHVVGWDAEGAERLVGLVQDNDGARRIAQCPRAGPVLEAADLTRELVSGRGTADEPHDVIGQPLEDAALVRWEALGLVLLCADMVGAMAGSLAIAVEYAGHREQFKRPIGSFQAIQHLAADQHVSMESSRSATYYAAWALDGLPPAEALTAARVAKAYVSPLARDVAEAVLQIHGGIGHTWEHIAHVYLRRVLLDGLTLGDASTHLGHIADGVTA